MKSTAATLDRGMSPGLRPGLNRDDFFVGGGIPATKAYCEEVIAAEERVPRSG